MIVRPADLWSAWTWSPGVLCALAAGAGLYALGTRHLWRRAGVGRGVRRWQAVCFTAALATLGIALLSPIDALGETLFSAHMAQHLMLVIVAAPLLVLGEPLLPLLWALPATRRRALGRWWLGAARLRATLAAMASPAVVWTAHTVAFWWWHLPGPYGAALKSEWIHAIEHGCFLITAVALWWFTLQPRGRRRWSYGTSVICLTLTLMQSGALGALLLFAATPWYPEHAIGAAAWGLTALEDQQLAGLIMSVPAGIVYIGASVTLLVQWMGRDDAASVRPPRKARFGAAAA